MGVKLIPFDNGRVRGYYLDTCKKPTREDILRQMRNHYEFIDKNDLWDYFDDELAFERYLIRKWSEDK